MENIKRIRNFDFSDLDLETFIEDINTVSYLRGYYYGDLDFIKAVVNNCRIEVYRYALHLCENNSEDVLNVLKTEIIKGLIEFNDYELSLEGEELISFIERWSGINRELINKILERGI